MEKIKGIRIDEFTRAYIECALWSSTDESNDSGGDPIDQSFDIDDITRDALRSMAKDCRDFQKAFADLLTQASATLPCSCGAGDDTHLGHTKGCATNRTYDKEQAGHDFWLTRNRHGAGFWDRGLGEVGDKLTTAAHSYGDSNLYINRKRVHVS